LFLHILSSLLNNVAADETTGIHELNVTLPELM